MGELSWKQVLQLESSLHPVTAAWLTLDSKHIIDERAQARSPYSAAPKFLASRKEGMINVFCCLKL